MKNKLLKVLLIGGVLLVMGCGKTDSSEKNDQPTLCSYDEIYDGESKEKFDVVSKLTNFNRANYGYRFNDTQGYNNWRYVKKVDNDYADLIYDNGQWVDEEGLLKWCF